MNLGDVIAEPSTFHLATLLPVDGGPVRLGGIDPLRDGQYIPTVHEDTHATVVAHVLGPCAGPSHFAIWYSRITEPGHSLITISRFRRSAPFILTGGSGL